jgi:hypothetical protein
MSYADLYDGHFGPSDSVMAVANDPLPLHAAKPLEPDCGGKQPHAVDPSSGKVNAVAVAVKRGGG